MSNRTFRNILIPKEFDSLTTPEKIKLALEKGIFKIASNYPKGSDFSELDFSIYDDKKFDFLEHYDIDDYGIMLNYDIPYEICNLLCLRVSHSYKSHQFLKEIQFKLEAYNTPEEKLNFLNGEIEEINPFQLEELLVDFDKKKSSLELSGLQPMELVSRNKNLLYDWLTNGIIYEANFEAYETVNAFCVSYSKFIYVQYCYNEIISIKNELLPEPPKRFDISKKLHQFLTNIDEDKKYEFLHELKLMFPSEKGKSIRAMIDILSSEELVLIGPGEFKKFYQELKEHFDRNIGQYQSIQNKKIIYSDTKKPIEKKLNPLIIKYKTN